MMMLSLLIVTDGSTAAIIAVLARVPGMVSISDLIRLSQFDCWRTYDLTLQSFYTYYPALPLSQIVQTVGISLAMSAVYLLLGYHFFHVDDMN